MEEATNNTATQELKSPQRERKAFLFRASFLDAIDCFSEEEKGKIAMKIIQYGLDITEEVISLEQEEQKTIGMVLRPIKDKIDIQKRRYRNKQTINDCIAYLRKFPFADREEGIKALKRLFIKAGNQDILDIKAAIQFVLPQTTIQSMQKIKIQQQNNTTNNTPRHSRGEGLTRQIF